MTHNAAQSSAEDLHQRFELDGRDRREIAVNVDPMRADCFLVGGEGRRARMAVSAERWQSRLQAAPDGRRASHFRRWPQEVRG